ncbi:hypothetical protein CAPTEDRAFT_199726 [Capitella teleta]|uniref:Peptidase S1 domain-containing protein n=1 Tax=Capitella teleta TaxID=283909 RepID=R7V354_CAPTE|nr:hypothetical protein CAPTEDRAFT_199726 [Capitella teleta]|eukprot:ELU12994.1 hypothetical protein CAPTEDRAFT_199726 [Capitella teleta]
MDMTQVPHHPCLAYPLDEYHHILPDPECGPAHDIIGGEPSAKGKWPWVVAIVHQDTGSFICGGSLVQKQWVLTAAHCLHGAPADLKIAVKVAAYNLTANDEAERIPIEKIIEHPDYVPSQSTNGVHDLSLLKLERPSDLSDPCISTIDLPPITHEFSYSLLCWIIGWGKTDPSNEGISEILNERRVNVLKNDECQTRWDVSPVKPTINYYNVCVDEEDETSACYGDSGSPMQCYLPFIGKWVFGGVSSWGSGACTQFPSVYMRVSSYNSWIRYILISE